MAADLELPRFQRSQANRVRKLDRQRECLLVIELGSAEAAQQRPAKMCVACVGAEQFHRLLTTRADQVGALLEHRDRGLHSGQTPDIAEQALVEALRAACGKLKAHLPYDAVDKLLDRVVGLARTICEANSSATPTAIPITANSSCASLARRRTL